MIAPRFFRIIRAAVTFILAAGVLLPAAAPSIHESGGFQRGSLADPLYPRGRHPEVGFASRAKLLQHFEKHGGEFPGLTREEYLRRAQDLRDRKTGDGVLEFVREDRVITRFDRKSGDFLAFDRNLTIRTFFKPNDGEAYFKRQQRRIPREP
jgi:hypothetical protein